MKRVYLKQVVGGFAHKDLPFLFVNDVEYDYIRMKFFIELPLRISIREFFIENPNNNEQDHVLIMYKKRLITIPYKTYFKYFDFSDDDESYDNESYDNESYDDESYDDESYDDESYEVTA